jgi:hypothetical protein
VAGRPAPLVAEPLEPDPDGAGIAQPRGAPLGRGALAGRRRSPRDRRELLDVAAYARRLVRR